jgi:iron complex outermembrane receptor protein/hemoglobin/transferrin/lactoferrin receptor protein
MRIIKCNLFFRSLCACLLITINVYAEDPGGVIKGKVFSADGNILFGAHISLPSLGRGTATDEKGEFLISNVPKGKHRLVISFIGYNTETLTADLSANQIIEITIYLKPASFQTEPVVVTGSPYSVNPLNSPQNIISLSGRDKIRSESSSIGKTLESLPGIYNISAGYAAGKPVIHGHTGERVLILNDGITQEYQQYGERHSPTLDAFCYDRIEIIKGAASLLYGSDAIGGAVNLIPHPYHFTPEGFYELGGALAGGYTSNNNGFMTGIKLNSSSNIFSINGNLIRRKGDNFTTPDVAPYSVTLKRDDPKFTGEIPNTNFEQLNGSFGIGYLSHAGIVSLDYNHYLNKNNFLLPDGNPIGLRLENQVVNIKGNLPFYKLILKPKFSYQRNHRQATRSGLSYPLLPDSAYVDLILNVYTARVEAENVDILDLSGTIGTEIKYYDHKNAGRVPLQPAGNFNNYALFLFEEWEEHNFILNFGARFDYRNQTFYGTTVNPLLQFDDNRSYTNLSGSFGIAYKFSEQFSITGNVSRGFRTPSFFNLYVYGLHGGVFAFQIGNPDLKNESSLDFSASLRFRNNEVSANATLFHNLIDNYIFLYNAPNHPLAPQGEAFVFSHDQADAEMLGLELSSDVAIFDWLLLTGSYSMIKSEFISGPYNGQELPLMPPYRLTAGVKFLLPDLSVIPSPYFSVNAKFVSCKKAAGIYEPFAQFDEGMGPDIPFGVCSTEKYNLVDLEFGFDLKLYSQPVNFDLSITNLFNEAYRDFLDTYKGYALSPGRSFNLKVNIPLNK